MRVLIVDDDADLLLVMESCVQSLGHEVVWACDARQALGALAGVELVITDLHMPGQTGVQLARAIRVRRPALPILFSTGACPEDDLVRQASGLGPVLRKPWGLTELKRALDDMGA